MPDNSGDNADGTRFAQEIARLSEAIRDLAQRTQAPDNDGDREQRRLRQRVDFGYRALGTLMGRAKNKGFDVRVIDARWATSSTKLELLHLPDTAAWVELRSGQTIELLEIARPAGKTVPASTQQSKARRQPNETPDGYVQPDGLTPNDRIDSLLVLRVRQGPPIAIGPRVEPSQVHKRN